MTPYEALYRRPYRSPICWTEVGERPITGPDLIRDTSEKVGLIQKRLFTYHSRQKSYADKVGLIEVGERPIIGPDLIRDTSEKVGLIQKRLLTYHSRQKSYADKQR